MKLNVILADGEKRVSKEIDFETRPEIGHIIQFTEIVGDQEVSELFRCITMQHIAARPPVLLVGQPLKTKTVPVFAKLQQKTKPETQEEKK